MIPPEPIVSTADVARACASQDDCPSDCLRRADPATAPSPAVALQHARRAFACATAVGRAQDAARSAAWICQHLMRLGQYRQVLEAAVIAAPLLDPPERVELRRQVLFSVALAGSELGEFGTALAAADDLMRISTRHGADGTAMQAAVSLAVCCERMGDSWQAVRLLSAAIAERRGSEPRQILIQASNGLCATCIGIMHRLLHTGADDEAAAVMAQARVAGERALALVDPVHDPVYEVVVGANLAEVLLYQGDIERAGPMIVAAHGRAVERGLGAYAWRIQATRGSWMVANGDPAGALAVVERVLVEAGPDAPQQTAVRAHHVAYRACRALGRFEQALAHLEHVERSERRRAMAQLRAQSLLFVTRTEAQHAQWQAAQARLDADHHRERAAEFAAAAERDPLTGLGNRRHFDRRCAELLSATERDGRPLALAVIDVDHFKAVNDAHGHATGDRVLQDLAQLLSDNTRTRDIVVRHGGEEFVVVLPGMAAERAAEFCERLRQRVAARSWSITEAPELHVTVSIGLATAGPYDAAGLMALADSALFRAKRGGRNRVERAAT